MLLSTSKDQVLRGGRRYGWIVMVFGRCGPARVTLCVPSGASSSLGPWHPCMGMTEMRGPQSGRTSVLQELSQATRTATTQGWGKCLRGWLAAGWAVERDKTGYGQVWMAEEELGCEQVTLQPLPPGQELPG